MYEWINESTNQWIWKHILAIPEFALGHIYFILVQFIYKQSQIAFYVYEHKINQIILPYSWQSQPLCRQYLSMWLCTHMCYWIWFFQNISKCACSSSILLALWPNNSLFNNFLSQPNGAKKAQRMFYYHKMIRGVELNGSKIYRLCFSKKVHISLFSLKKLW